jgi:hypothetical protein
VTPRTIGTRRACGRVLLRDAEHRTTYRRIPGCCRRCVAQCLRLFVVAGRRDVHAWALSGRANGFLNGGYSSVLAVLPSEGIVISVMTNAAGDPKALVFPVAEKLAASL